jgi:hypothetical protein
MIRRIRVNSITYWALNCWGDTVETELKYDFFVRRVVAELRMRTCHKYSKFRGSKIA